MDRRDKDEIAKIVCYGLGCLFGYWVLMWLLPYIALALALYAFGCLILGNFNDRNHRR